MRSAASQGTATGCAAAWYAHTTTTAKSRTAAVRAFERRERAPPARSGPIARCFQGAQKAARSCSYHSPTAAQQRASVAGDALLSASAPQQYHGST